MCHTEDAWNRYATRSLSFMLKKDKIREVLNVGDILERKQFCLLPSFVVIRSYSETENVTFGFESPERLKKFNNSLG